MSQLQINTLDEAKALRKRIVYASSIIANIRARIDKYGEAYADNITFAPIWSGVEDARGNLKDRIRQLAQQMGMNVDWETRDDLAHFTRKVHLIEVVQGLN